MYKSEGSSYLKLANNERKLLKKKWKQEKILKKLKATQKTEDKDKPIEIASKENKVPSTVSIAVPGSILDNAQSAELRTYLVGQVARAACMFQVDEIIVFDDYGNTLPKSKGVLNTDMRHCVQFARLLQYLECPQYLRKFFFPIHDDLRYAGILNPLDAQHHMRQNDEFAFRDGVVTNKPVKKGNGCYVNVGLLKEVEVDKTLVAGTRVTVKLHQRTTDTKKYRGTIVSPSLPRTETGIYWGYNIRISNSFTEIFTQSPYADGYDITIGTSERGTNVDSIFEIKYNHALIVFGGLNGLEEAVENDPNTTEEDPRFYFHHYLNTLPNQGSGTIRTEEAVLITLSSLRTKLRPLFPVKLYARRKIELM